MQIAMAESSANGPHTAYLDRSPTRLLRSGRWPRKSSQLWGSTKPLHKEASGVLSLHPTPTPVLGVKPRAYVCQASTWALSYSPSPFLKVWKGIRDLESNFKLFIQKFPESGGKAHVYRLISTHGPPVHSLCSKLKHWTLHIAVCLCCVEFTYVPRIRTGARGRRTGWSWPRLFWVVGAEYPVVVRR